MGLQNIFPVPIYTTILDNKVVEYMENLITPRLRDLDQNISQKTDFYKSRIASPNELSPFFDYINSSLQDYSTKSNIKLFDKIEYWIQDYSYKEYHGAHTHLQSPISGIYYIRSESNPGNLRFTNPNPLFNVTSFNEGPKEAICFEIKPQKGLLVLFPGWLLHEALASTDPNCIRTCLAFNLRK